MLVLGRKEEGTPSSETGRKQRGEGDLCVHLAPFHGVLSKVLLRLRLDAVGTANRYFLSSFQPSLALHDETISGARIILIIMQRCQ